MAKLYKICMTVLVVLCMALGITGCAGGDGVTPTEIPIPTPVPKVTATPTPTPTSTPITTPTPTPTPTTTPTPTSTPTPVLTPNKMVFSYRDSGAMSTRSFKVSSSPWELRYTTAWAGTLDVTINQTPSGAKKKVIASQKVEPVWLYKTCVYNCTGTIYFTVSPSEAEKAWHLEVIENPEPLQVPFAYTGIGSTNTPPFEVSSSPWKLKYRIGWDGDFEVKIVSITDGSSKGIVSGSYEDYKDCYTFVYDCTGPFYLSVSGVPPDRNWWLWVEE